MEKGETVKRRTKEYLDCTVSSARAHVRFSSAPMLSWVEISSSRLESSRAGVVSSAPEISAGQLTSSG